MSLYSPEIVVLPEGVKTEIGAEYYLVCKLCKRAYFETFGDFYRHQSFHHKVGQMSFPAMQGPPQRRPGLRASM